MQVAEVINRLLENMVKFLDEVPCAQPLVKEYKERVLSLTPEQQTITIKTMLSPFQFPDDALVFILTQAKVDEDKLSSEHREKIKKYVGALMDISKDA